MNASYSLTNAEYLSAQSSTDALAWLAAHKLPAEPESAAEMIAAYYPGGLQWFIAQHLTSPDDAHISTHTQE